MPSKTKKQSFISQALYQLSACAANHGVDLAELDKFEQLAIQYLKQSFKNGVGAGYQKAKAEGRK